MKRKAMTHTGLSMYDDAAAADDDDLVYKAKNKLLFSSNSYYI
jgi:hypothetical protein